MSAAGHSEKSPLAKPKVLTVGRERPEPLDLDDHKCQAKSPKEEGASNLIPCPKQTPPI